jgi:transposase-like protein
MNKTTFTHPPFCPNRHCIHHDGPPPAERWYYGGGFYHTRAFGPVRRYRCRACGLSFSDQTFSLDYHIKHPVNYRRLFEAVVGGAGLRTIARQLSVSHQLVTNRLARLARQDLALQAELLAGHHLCENLAADGFESFVASQYEPNNIHLLVGSKSQFLYEFDYAHLKRKGRMTDEQREQRRRLEERLIRPRRSISCSFSSLLETMERLVGHTGKKRLTLFTDEKEEYRAVIERSPLLSHLRVCGQFRHVRISSCKARTLQNRLFPVNYYDRQLRKDNANHVRETVQFSRSVAGCLDRMAVYQLWHNYFKPYRIDDGPKAKLRHGQLAGIDRARIEEGLHGIFESRKFLSKVPLSWSQALVWFRMVGNTGRRAGGFWPSYIWM